MAIDEHPVHMVFAPVITKHPGIQDGGFGRQTARDSATWNSVRMLGRERVAY